MKTFFFLFIFICFQSLANTNYFEIKLDKFTLAKSQDGLNDTIALTEAAWTSSDSLHLKVYICGETQLDVKSILTVRDEGELLFRRFFVNKHLEYRYSFPTSLIDPKKVKFFTITLGAENTAERIGRSYRMGYFKFT